MIRTLHLSLLSIAALASAFIVLQDEQQEESKSSEEKERILVPASDDKAIERKDYMRTKLLFTQNLFEGLTLGDFEQINDSVNEIKGITQGEEWVAIDDDVYRKLTADFNMTTRRLAEAVESKNLDAVALRYYQMSTSCIDCHKHIREAEYEL